MAHAIIECGERHVKTRRKPCKIDHTVDGQPVGTNRRDNFRTAPWDLYPRPSRRGKPDKYKNHRRS